VPLFEALANVLRVGDLVSYLNNAFTILCSQENRLAAIATVDQQRELMRYMRGLNEWLERDVHDRQAELRGVSARVDQLRNELGRMGIPIGRVQGEFSTTAEEKCEADLAPQILGCIASHTISLMSHHQLYSIQVSLPISNLQDLSPANLFQSSPRVKNHQPTSLE
jgi:hypothetical protein